MEGEEDAVKKARMVDARARNISHNVRCTECGSQSIEDSQADIAILLRKNLRLILKGDGAQGFIHSYCFLQDLTFYSQARKGIDNHSIAVSVSASFSRPETNLIRDEIQSGKSDKEIYKKLEEDYGETVLYAPKFDLQTAALWMTPLLVAGAAGGIWAYGRHRQKTNVHIMALNLVRGVPLTPKEKETMLDLLTPPPPEGITPASWWRRWPRQ